MKKYKLKSEISAIQFDDSPEWNEFLLKISNEHLVERRFFPDKVIIGDLEVNPMDYVVDNGELVVVGQEEFEKMYTQSASIVNIEKMNRGIFF